MPPRTAYRAGPRRARMANTRASPAPVRSGSNTDADEPTLSGDVNQANVSADLPTEIRRYLCAKRRGAGADFTAADRVTLSWSARGLLCPKTNTPDVFQLTTTGRTKHACQQTDPRHLFLVLSVHQLKHVRDIGHRPLKETLPDLTTQLLEGNWPMQIRLVVVLPCSDIAARIPLPYALDELVGTLKFACFAVDTDVRHGLTQREQSFLESCLERGGKNCELMHPASFTCGFALAAHPTEEDVTWMLEGTHEPTDSRGRGRPTPIVMPHAPDGVPIVVAGRREILQRTDLPSSWFDPEWWAADRERRAADAEERHRRQAIEEAESLRRQRQHDETDTEEEEDEEVGATTSANTRANAQPACDVTAGVVQREEDRPGWKQRWLSRFKRPKAVKETDGAQAQPRPQRHVTFAA